MNLYLGVNYLTGPIPVELSRLAQLEDLWLSLNRLSGPIPPELGMLQALRNLELDENRLSGGVPWELGSISSLSTLRLSENSLEGCIRSSLRNVQTNDLDRLGLADCPQTVRVPAPVGLGVSLASSTFTVTWGAVSGAGYYEVQERTDGPGGEWARVGATTATTLTYSLSGGPECGATFEFRVRSFGDATTYAAGWSEGSGVQSVVTASCNRAPEFATSTYTFMVAEDATTTDLVGTVSATDPDSDPVSHAITSGNSAGRFAIATSTGDVTVAGELDHESVPSYTLVVEARDDREGVATTTVEYRGDGRSRGRSACTDGTGRDSGRWDVHRDVERGRGSIGLRAAAAGARFWRRLGRGRDHRRVDTDVQPGRRACVRHDVRVQGAGVR